MVDQERIKLADIAQRLQAQVYAISTALAKIGMSDVDVAWACRALQEQANEVSALAASEGGE